MLWVASPFHHRPEPLLPKHFGKEWNEQLETSVYPGLTVWLKHTHTHTHTADVLLHFRLPHLLPPVACGPLLSCYAAAGQLLQAGRGRVNNAFHFRSSTFCRMTNTVVAGDVIFLFHTVPPALPTSLLTFPVIFLLPCRIHLVFSNDARLAAHQSCCQKWEKSVLKLLAQLLKCTFLELWLFVMSQMVCFSRLSRPVVPLPGQWEHTQPGFILVSAVWTPVTLQTKSMSSHRKLRLMLLQKAVNKVLNMVFSVGF